jgi:hypothetical protein
LQRRANVTECGLCKERSSLWLSPRHSTAFVAQQSDRAECVDAEAPGFGSSENTRSGRTLTPSQLWTRAVFRSLRNNKEAGPEKQLSKCAGWLRVATSNRQLSLAQYQRRDQRWSRYHPLGSTSTQAGRDATPNYYALFFFGSSKTMSHQFMWTIDEARGHKPGLIHRCVVWACEQREERLCPPLGTPLGTLSPSHTRMMR